jgi:hypothetical protein
MHLLQDGVDDDVNHKDSTGDTNDINDSDINDINDSYYVENYEDNLE